MGCIDYMYLLRLNKIEIGYLQNNFNLEKIIEFETDISINVRNRKLKNRGGKKNEICTVKERMKKKI